MEPVESNQAEGSEVPVRPSRPRPRIPVLPCVRRGLLSPFLVRTVQPVQKRRAPEGPLLSVLERTASDAWDVPNGFNSHLRTDPFQASSPPFSHEGHCRLHGHPREGNGALFPHPGLSDFQSLASCPNDAVDGHRLVVGRHRGAVCCSLLAVHLQDRGHVVIVNSLDRHRLTGWLAGDQRRRFSSVHRRIDRHRRGRLTGPRR